MMQQAFPSLGCFVAGVLETFPSLGILAAEWGNLLENATYLEGMAKFGIDQAKLEAVMLKVEEVEKTFARYQKETGETQEATLVRDETVDALQEWCGDFRSVAKIALEEKPQMLEALGVVVKR